MTANVSVAAFYGKCVDEYNAILDSNLPSASDKAQDKVHACCVDFGKLMEHIKSSGVLSRNEDFEDMSTQALGLVTVPFYLGQLAGRRVTGADHKARKQVLAVSSQLLRDFLDGCENVNLLPEDEVEKRLEYRALDRSGRVEAHRRKKDLQEKLNALEGRIRYEEAKIRRMRRLTSAAADDDDAELEDQDTPEMILARREADLDREEERGDGGGATSNTGDGIADEVLRERHVLRARLCIEEAFETIQMNQREADMLGGLTEDEMKSASAKYQEALTEDRTNRPSSTIHFPGAKKPNLQDPELARMYYSRETGVQGPPVQFAQSGVNYKVAGCGHLEPIGEQRINAYDDAFQDRNAPTQTLQEFAEQETAFMHDQMRIQAEAMNRKEEEDAMLGREGREERDRKKDSDWSDWKDDNPAVGLTNKGNYS
jgi:hypothetical protein